MEDERQRATGAGGGGLPPTVERADATAADLGRVEPRHDPKIDRADLTLDRAEPRLDPNADRAEPRVETAVTPVIRAESVHIPTPAWGALSAADTELLEAELVDTDAVPELDDWDGEAEAARPAWPGWVAFLLAVGAAVVHGVAVVAEAGKDYELATILAWVAIGVSIAAVVGGIVAAILRWGRGPGIAAAVVGALANPWLLLQVLTVLRG